MTDNKFISLPWQTTQLIQDGLEKFASNLDSEEAKSTFVEMKSLIDAANERGQQKLDALCERHNIDPSLPEMERWAAVGWALSQNEPEYKPPTHPGRPKKKVSIDVSRSEVIEQFRTFAKKHIPHLSKLTDKDLIQAFMLVPSLSWVFPQSSTIDSMANSLARGNTTRRNSEK